MIIVFIVFSVTIAIGQTPLNQDNQKILNQGNAAFAKGDYDGAKTIYESLLGDKNYEDSIKYNLGIIAYETGAYDEALEYLKDIDNYKLYGNTYYKMGEIAEDRQDKISCYEEAIKRYMSGIKSEPNNVELKYNYEFVKKILDDLKEEQKEEQEKKNQDNETENKDKNDSEDGENQQNQDNKEDDKKQKNQGNQENEEDKDKKDSESTSSDKEKESKSDESEQGKTEKADINEETIKQILKLLEQQEKQSLKNNQGIIQQGKEEGNDW